MRHYFVRSIRQGVAQLVSDDESVLSVDASALPDGIEEGGEVCLKNGEFCLCAESEARRADIFRSALRALEPDRLQ